jgi:hypothetical protein
MVDSTSWAVESKTKGGWTVTPNAKSGILAAKGFILKGTYSGGVITWKDNCTTLC